MQWKDVRRSRAKKRKFERNKVQRWFHRSRGEKIIGESDRAFHFDFDFDFDFAFTVTNAATTATRRRRIGSSVFNNYYSFYMLLRMHLRSPERIQRNSQITLLVVRDTRHRGWQIVRSASLINAPNDAPLKTIRGSRFWIMHSVETSIGSRSIAMGIVYPTIIIGTRYR